MLTDPRIIRRICYICCLVLFSACTGSRVINWNPDDYTVRSGDTIYSIAWKYELDPFELARWNSLSSPYMIHPGQRLHTREVEGETSMASHDTSPAATPVVAVSKSTPHLASRPVPHSTHHPKPAPSVITVRKGDTLYGLAKRYRLSATRLARINDLKSPYLLKTGQTLTLLSKPEQKSKSHHTSTATTVVATAPGTRYKPKPKPSNSGAARSGSDNKRVRWAWPVTGAVVNRFNNSRSDSKGIEIAGREGSPVRAAAPGKVVYSGNGLISYGNLVIIKHNHNFLSAYAYNRKLLVSEGDTVKAGQKIAELGRSGTASPRLHFEIRKNGKPVNPLSYLPSS